MPQMMPLNWLILLSFFSLLLLSFNVMNFYISSKTLNLKMNKKMNYNSSFWKW
nr:ATP synthase F0 subunit 8 [Sinomiopteryx grahami]